MYIAIIPDKMKPGFLRRAGVRRIVMKKHCCRHDDDRIPNCKHSIIYLYE